MVCLTLGKIVFIMVGAVASGFYGWWGYTIIGRDGKQWRYDLERRFKPESEYVWAFWVHQMFINFAGSAIGFVAGYYLIFCRHGCRDLFDVFLLLVAVAGVFGYLPWRVYNVSLK
jgi:hypothetical protein